MKIKANLKLNPRESRVWVELDEGKILNLPVKSITVFQSSDNFLMAQIAIKLDEFEMDSELTDYIELQDAKGKVINLKKKDEKTKRSNNN